MAMTLRLVAEGGTADPTAAAVADLIDAVEAAAGLLAEELDGIAASRAPVSEGTALRLEVLAARLRPAVRMRARLGDLEPAALEAGVRVWVARRGAPAALDAG